MTLTALQHRVLCRLSDGDWIIGADLSAPGVLGVLRRRGLIRDDMSHNSVPDALWTITQAGVDALKAAGQ